MEPLENGKSANQLWKESGTSLSFADWIQREKDKGRFLPNKLVSEVTDSITNSVKNSLGVNSDGSTTPEKKDTNKVVGLNPWVIVASLSIIGGAILYSIISKKKTA